MDKGMSLIKSRARKAFYGLFRRTATLTIAGHRLRFSTGEPRLYDRVCRAGGEREQMEMFISHLREGDVVWDVGAYVGMYALFSSQAVGASGRVYAFEPEPDAAQLGRRNCRLNAVTNVTYNEFALGKEDAASILYRAAAEQNAVSSLRPDAQRAGSGISIPVRRGDNLVERGEVKMPTAIKMDVEGAEFDALSGMRGVLASPGCRLLFLELHPRELRDFDSSPEAVQALIASTGFTLAHERVRGTEVHQFYLKATDTPVH